MASTAVTMAHKTPRRLGTQQRGTVREIVLHLIEETAAHSGHLEIARELQDGQTRLCRR